jgi:hypothetical protein
MGLWWIPIGIVAWFSVAIVAGLCIGPVLGHWSRARESVDRHWGEAADAHDPRWDEPVLDIPLARAPVVIRQREAAIAMREQNVTLRDKTWLQGR